MREGFAILIMVQKLTEPKPATQIIIESFTTRNNIHEMYKLGGEDLRVFYRWVD